MYVFRGMSRLLQTMKRTSPWTARAGRPVSQVVTRETGTGTAKGGLFRDPDGQWL